MKCSAWNNKALGEVIENLDSMRIPVKEADRRPGPYPYYGASGVVDHVDSYIFDGENLLVAEDGENLRTRQTPVAFLARGKYWVNNHAHIVRGNQLSDTRFLMYALSQADISAYLTGSTMPKLTQANMNRIPVPLPPLPIQKRIAHILGTLDDKIELNRRMNETLEGMARAIFQSWFIDFDPVHAKAAGRNTGLPKPIADLFPVEFQNSELGLIPKGWRVLRFSDSVEVAGGGTPRTSVAEYWNGEIPWYSVVDAPRAGDVFVINTEKRVTSAGIENSSANILPAGVTIVSARGTVGKIALTGAPMAMNQSCYALRGKGGGASYYTYFTTRCAIAAMQQLAHGSVFDTITRETLTRINVACAHADVVTQFEKLVAPMMMRILENVRQILVLQITRDTLLPQLLAGTMHFC